MDRSIEALAEEGMRRALGHRHAGGRVHGEQVAKLRRGRVPQPVLVVRDARRGHHLATREDRQELLEEVRSIEVTPSHKEEQAEVEDLEVVNDLAELVA